MLHMALLKDHGSGHIQLNIAGLDMNKSKLILLLPADVRELAVLFEEAAFKHI